MPDMARAATNATPILSSASRPAPPLIVIRLLFSFLTRLLDAMVRPVPPSLVTVLFSLARPIPRTASSRLL